MDESNPRQPGEPSVTFTAETIRVLTGVEAVRKRPAMYVGSTDTRGLHHLVWELVENALAEVWDGFCRHIEVTLGRDGSVTVGDDGRGLPGDFRRDPTALVPLLTRMHYSGRESGIEYRPSFSSAGIGLAVVNALSRRLTVEVRRDGGLWRQEFSRGEPSSGLEHLGPSRTSGTKVTLAPDPDIFAAPEFDPQAIAVRLRELAFLCPETRFSLRDERGGRSETWQYPGGLADFVRDLNRGREPLHDPFLIKGRFVGGEATAALQYHKGPCTDIRSFANLGRTRLGGTHETGLKKALAHALSDQARRLNLLRWPAVELEAASTRRGLTAVISVLLHEPWFEGATKEKLGGRDVAHSVYALAYPRLSQWLAEKPDVAQRRILYHVMNPTDPPGV